MRSNGFDYKSDYRELLQLLCTLAQRPGPVSVVDERLHTGQVLTAKLLRHFMSIWRLNDGHDAAEFGIPCSSYIDHSSINILTRAAIETFLVYQYLFGDTDRPDAMFRYHKWQLGGLLDRQDPAATAHEHLQKQKSELRHIESLRDKIRDSPLFDQYTTKQQKSILGGDWRVGTNWTEIALDAGLDKDYFVAAYSHLCGYSHTSFNSAIQIQHADSVADLAWLANAALSIGVTTMAHFVFAYCRNVSSANRYLTSNPAARRFAGKWLCRQRVSTMPSDVWRSLTRCWHVPANFVRVTWSAQLAV